MISGIPGTEPSTWTDGAVLTDPISGTTLVSVSLGVGHYGVTLLGSGSVAWAYDFIQRTSGGATVHTQRFRGSAGGNHNILIPHKLTLSEGDVLVCVLAEAGVTGKVQMSLVTQPWA